jgi:ATP-binding cassette subfamily B protein
VSLTKILENLKWSNSEASENDCWNALKLSNAFNFVKELPEGINTIVGDRGVRLSGGQRQRIALARALVRNPDLLILDEATSALDSESEKLIQDSINTISKNTTILIIAHRLFTISKSDFVYVLEKGQIVESGSYNVLSLKENGKLNKMLKLENSKIHKN